MMKKISKPTKEELRKLHELEQLIILVEEEKRKKRLVEVEELKPRAKISVEQIRNGFLMLMSARSSLDKYNDSVSDQIEKTRAFYGGNVVYAKTIKDAADKMVEWYEKSGIEGGVKDEKTEQKTSSARKT